MNSFRAALVSLSLLCLACSQVGPEGKEGAAARLSVTAEPAGSQCPNGGQKVESAVGTGPVTTAYLCNGGNGGPGGAAVVTLSDEPAGAHCAQGGKKLQTSVGDGPVTTSFICNGEAGAGVLVVAEPEGTNCAAGGVKVTGADGNARYVCNGLNGANGTNGPAGSSGAKGTDGQDVTADALLPGDTTCPAGGVKLTSASSTTYVCNGVSPTVTVEPEPEGAHCPSGGQRVTASSPGGTTTTYVCNGVMSRLSLSPEPPGQACAAGGFKVVSYVDANGNGLLDAAELATSSTQYLCDGASPTLTVEPEPAGTQCPYGGNKVTATAPGGTTTTYVCNGAASRTSLTPEPPGPNCPAGGFKATSYVDANNNGQMDAAEDVGSTTQYVCNGEMPDGGQPAQPCTGPYEALQWDGSAWQCVQVNATGPSGGRARGFEVVDSWGTAWDGLERPAATWTNAKAACEAVGGRLPTATEVWRVGASQSAEVGTSYDSNWLWTLTPWHVNGATQQHTQGRLNDTGGDTAISYAADSTKAPYRCVWPVAPQQGFQGTRCYGPANAPCFQAVGEGRRRNLDALDRPSLTYAGATWECAFAGAHLPLSLSLAENIPNGLPNGSGAWLWTADHTRYDLADVVKWTGTNPAGWNATYSSSWAWATRDNIQGNRFRCMGDASGPSPNTGAVPADTATWGDPFVGQGTGLSSHGKNLAPATWDDAVQDCFSRGGQLPHTRDWMELIRDGLPNGAGLAANWAWSSDWSHRSYVQVVRWAGVDRDFTGYSTPYATWAGHGAQAYPYRCTWYPVDAAYTGPGLCSGGQLTCYLSEKTAGTETVRTWADPVDRSPATWVNAVKTCAAEGGHLASMRDYVALVRDGLPQGQGTWVWSSDSEGDFTSNPAVAGLFKWGGGTHGTQTDWNTTLGYQDWAYRDVNNSYGYRCVWTNQVW